MVASVIIRQRRLRNPRNTFWLGVIFCNLLAFANALIEYAAYEMLSITACLIFRVTAGIPYTVEIHTIFKICHIYSKIYLAIIAITSQFAACHTGSMGCFDLSALSPRNRHCQTRCLCSITFLHSCCSTVYFTLLDQNVSVDRLWS